jgi:hypothetical protein
VTAALWTLGGVLVVIGGLWPLRSVLRRPRGDLDAARSAISALDSAIDRSAPGLPDEVRAEVDRCRLLAGAALAGRPDRDDCRRSLEWSSQGLARLAGR